MPTSPNPLAERDSNRISPTKAEADDKVPTGHSREKDAIQAKTTGEKYISPSDAMMSPTSQKLAEFKQKQIGKRGGLNPLARSLFTRPAKGQFGNDEKDRNRKDDGPRDGA